MIRPVLFALLCLLVSAVATSAAFAASSAWFERPEVRIRLVSAVEGAGTLDKLPLALEVRLAPGWKTYWRAPGDGGLPPQLDWSGSENVGPAVLEFPAPRRFDILGVDSIGYQDRVLFPIEAAVERPGQPVRIALRADVLTCETVCIPQSAELRLDLPGRPSVPGVHARAIAEWQGRVPSGPSSLLAVDRAELSADGRSLRLALAGGRLDAGAGGLDVLVDAERTAFGVPRLRATGPGRAVADVPLRGAGAGDLAGRAARVTLLADDVAVEQEVVVGPPAGDFAAGLGGGMLAILLAAFLGGMILNLMPCVLPVLSIKLIGLAELGGAARRVARVGFLATAAGILVSFWLLAAGLVAVKAAGGAVGWGIQFQQPWFLAAMVVVLTLFAANLWGLFHVPAPGGLPGGGRDEHARPGAAFLTGMLATLLATPCSAPFVGTSVAFALAAGPGEIVAVFTALGLGLAAPYLAVAAVPGLATRLPRPGRWMVRLRLVLGLALVATAGWLGWVLAGVAGWSAALAAFAGAVTLLAVLGLSRRMSARARFAGAAVVVLAALVLPPVLASTPGVRPEVADWEPFDRDRLRRHVREGRVVLVDVTADWCITCRVNKLAVLEAEPVAGRLGDDVVAMRADWTRPDPDIARYLASFGRYGIPFNAVYGPGAPVGQPLPELLTTEVVLRALERAAGPAADRARGG